MTLLVLVIVLAVLFVLAYFTKRRYGVLGLGLTAGYVLSEHVAKEVAGFLRYLDFPIEPLTPISAARIALILLPALLLMVAGPKYGDKRSRIVGSIIFALFGTFLVLAPIVASLPANDAQTMEYLRYAAENSSLITALGVALAVFDLMKTHRIKPADKKSKH